MFMSECMEYVFCLTFALMSRRECARVLIVTRAWPEDEYLKYRLSVMVAFACLHVWYVVRVCHVSEYVKWVFDETRVYCRTLQ